jgi:Zn-dependent M16 (insulinase) family peptidase
MLVSSEQKRRSALLFLFQPLKQKSTPSTHKQMGTAKESFVELTERIGRKTGGLSVYPFMSAKRGSTEPIAYVVARGKAMGGKADDLIELMRDVLTGARLDDKARFTQMVLETKAGLEAGLVGSGHRFAAARLAAQRSVAGWAGEVTGGLSYLEFIRALSKRVESDWDSVKVRVVVCVLCFCCGGDEGAAAALSFAS